MEGNPEFKAFRSLPRRRKGAKDEPMFIRNTFEMISHCDRNYAGWTVDGKSFWVKDPEDLAEFVIPKYFKHNKFSSFVRQLNFYGFRKVKSHGHGHSLEGWLEFHHPSFQRGRPDLLCNIKRESHFEEPAQVWENTKYDYEVADLRKQVSDLKESLSVVNEEVATLKKLLSKLVPQYAEDLNFIDSYDNANTNAKKRKQDSEPTMFDFVNMKDELETDFSQQENFLHNSEVPSNYLLEDTSLELVSDSENDIPENMLDTGLIDADMILNAFDADADDSETEQLQPDVRFDSIDTKLTTGLETNKTEKQQVHIACSDDLSPDISLQVAETRLASEAQNNTVEPGNSLDISIEEESPDLSQSLAETMLKNCNAEMVAQVIRAVAHGLFDSKVSQTSEKLPLAPIAFPLASATLGAFFSKLSFLYSQQIQPEQVVNQIIPRHAPMVKV